MIVKRLRVAGNAAVNSRDAEQMGVDEAIRYVKALMRWYGAKRSFHLANKIVYVLEQIRERVSESEQGAEKLRYERLVRQWQLLSREI